MLHQLIKEETRVLHHELEKLMHVEEIMNGSLSYEQYKDMLLKNYLITEKYESSIFNSLSSVSFYPLKLEKRIKIDALRKDLVEAGMDKKIDKGVENLTFERDYALGCLYVLEGATLGGNMIVKKLKENEHLKEYDLGFHYYQVYGEQLVSKWKQFCEIINEQPIPSYPKIVEGAKFIYSEFFNLILVNGEV